MVLRPSPFQHRRLRLSSIRHSNNNNNNNNTKRRSFQVTVCIIIVILISLNGGGDLQNYTLLLPSSSSSSESFQQLFLYNNDDETTTAVVKQQPKLKSTTPGQQKDDGDNDDPSSSSHLNHPEVKKKKQQQTQQQKDKNSIIIIPPKIILPEACRHRITKLSSSSSSNNNNPTTIIGHHHPTTTTSQQQQQQQPPPSLQQQQKRFKDISKTEDIPSEYIHNQPFQNYKPMSLIMYDNITGRVNYNKVKVPFEESLPTNTTMICIPDGIVVDNGIAGPYNYRRRPVNSNNNVSSSINNNNDDGDDPVDPINIYQSKDWFPTNINGFINKRPTVIDIPGLGIQLSGWTGFTHNHWPLDTLIRLGLVYDALTNGDDDDPLWRNAKIIVSSNNNLKKNQKQLMTPSQIDFYQRSNGIVVDPPISWLYDKLNLTSRLIASNGWLAKANTTIRFDLLVLPDITPQPKCGGNVRVKDPIFPRGTLLPIQKALGLTTLPRKTKETKYIVFSSRENARRRSVENNHRKLIIYNIEKMLIDMNINTDDDDGFKVIEWIYTNPQDRYDIMKQTLITIGVHGANLWNAAFMPPNGLLIEYNSYGTEFVQKDCRTCGYSLANAASLQYALVETPNFHYEKTNFYPPINDTIEIIKSFLINNKHIQ